VSALCRRAEKKRDSRLDAVMSARMDFRDQGRKTVRHVEN